MKTYVVTKSMLPMPKSKGVAPFLEALDIELTERCNNNCLHCYIYLPVNDAQAKAQEMTTAEVKHILVQAEGLGCLRVRFTGGEPLLRDDFAELYVFARRLGLKVMVFTNATLITQQLVDLWSRIPPLELIEVSVYGMTPASCEKVTRTPGSFEAAEIGIGLLRQYNIPFVVKSVFGFWDEAEIKTFEDFAATVPWMQSPPQYAVFFDLSARQDDGRNARIRQVRPSAQEGLRFITRNSEGYRQDMKQFCAKFMRIQGDKLFLCGAGCASSSVDAYGIFQPCMNLRAPACGINVKKNTLQSAREGLYLKLKEWRATNPEYLARCAKCFLMGLCEQCPAKAWSEHGRLDAPVEYLCQIAHAQARYLGLLQAQENAWDVKDWKERVDLFVNS